MSGAPGTSRSGEDGAPLVTTQTDLAAQDRRRHPRIAWEHHELAPVLLEVEQPGRDWHPVDATLVDLGEGGSGLLAGEPLEPGARVRLTFQLPSRVGSADGATEPTQLATWTGVGEVVHTRHTPDPVHAHVPVDAHRPHHHGVRFHDLEGEAERRLMGALYGPLPAGWAIERSTGSSSTGSTGAESPFAERFAVLKNGKRVAWGFGSYDRARSRAWSMHMDEVALARRRAAVAGSVGRAR